MKLTTLLQGIGLGASTMYLLDPDRGRRRRALLLDQWEHAQHVAQDFLGKSQRDLSNRATGVVAEAGSLFRHDGADDQILVARVRSKLGRYASHPHAITVSSRDGHVTLGGPVLADEAEDIIRAVRHVRGVQGVENRLEIHDRPANVAALQGGTGRSGEHPELLQESWTPATRAIAQLAGLTLMGKCLVQRDFTSILFGTLGFGLFLRAATNRSFGQLTGTSTCPQANRFQRTVIIHAPVEKVWDLMTDFPQVARFMHGVKEVQELGDNRYRWTLCLPGDTELQLEERITESVPHERLAWESISDSPISYTGTVLLQREPNDATRVNIHFDYTSPGGAIGDVVARLFGLDAASLFQDAIMRAKSYLETGKMPRDVHEVAG